MTLSRRTTPAATALHRVSPRRRHTGPTPPSPLPAPAPNRPLTSLALPEQVVVWSMRRHGIDPASLVADYRRIFRTDAFEALSQFRGMMHQLATVADLDVGALSDPRLTDTEAWVLDALARVQAGTGVPAPPAGPDHPAAGCTALRRFAQCLRRRDLVLTAGAAAATVAPPMAPVIPPPDAIEPSRPAVATVTGLVAAERWLLGAVRYWVRCLHRGGGPLPDLARQFDRLGQPDAAAALHAVLTVMAVSARRQVDVRCPNCPRLSPDETALLAAVAALQRDAVAPADGVLAAWLPEAAIRSGRRSLAVLAAGLTAAGLVLPIRPPTSGPADATGLSPPVATTAAGRRTLH